MFQCAGPQLLEQPISATLSHLTQAIQFLVENDFLDNVELVPGQAEEMEGRGIKVLDVSEGEDGVLEQGAVPITAGSDALVYVAEAKER